MSMETGTAAKKKPPEAETKELLEASARLDHERKNALAATNGNKVNRRAKTSCKGKEPELAKAPPRTVRTDFDLSLATFAKMTGLTQKALAKWEQDKAVRLDVEAASRVGRVARILNGLARVMQPAFIPTWIEQPNDACKEIGVSTEWHCRPVSGLPARTADAGTLPCCKKCRRMPIYAGDAASALEWQPSLL
jgi:DNA-binding transcriptional regulator YiaG